MKNKFLAGLLAMLGFSACSPWGDSDGDDVVMYGVLRESFVVKGAVTDTGENPVKGIQVVLRPNSEDAKYKGFPNDTVYTAADGTFKMRKMPAALPVGYIISAEDVDGGENGLFKPDELPLSFGPEHSDYTWSNEEGAILKEVRFVLEEDKE